MCYYCGTNGPSYHNTYGYVIVKICPDAYKEVCDFAEQTFVINHALSLLVNDIALIIKLLIHRITLPSKCIR